MESAPRVIAQSQTVFPGIRLAVLSNAAMTVIVLAAIFSLNRLLPPSLQNCPEEFSVLLSPCQGIEIVSVSAQQCELSTVRQRVSDSTAVPQLQPHT